jgi:hypothetical protein
MAPNRQLNKDFQLFRTAIWSKLGQQNYAALKCLQAIVCLSIYRKFLGILALDKVYF